MPRARSGARVTAIRRPRTVVMMSALSRADDGAHACRMAAPGHTRRVCRVQAWLGGVEVDL